MCHNSIRLRPFLYCCVLIERCAHDLAKEYAKSPDNTVVVSADNRSRTEINGRVHGELQRGGLVSNKEHQIRALVPRQDLTGADRTRAARYEVGDLLRYSRSSKRQKSRKASTHR